MGKRRPVPRARRPDQSRRAGADFTQAIRIAINVGGSMSTEPASISNYSHVVMDDPAPLPGHRTLRTHR
jgi:hypothetical protein